MADTYYPFLSDLITLDQLPSGLSFISDDSNSIFSKIRYQNFISEHSLNESTGYYQLNIIVFSALQLDIPGTELVLTLNADLQSDAVTQSVIPISLNWRWNLLRYLEGFNITQFAGDATAYFYAHVGVITNMASIMPQDDNAVDINAWLNVFYSTLLNVDIK